MRGEGHKLSKTTTHLVLPDDAPANGVYIGCALELASLLERLAGWADDAVLDGGSCLGEDMGTSSYAVEHPSYEEDGLVTRKLAARIRELLAASTE